jgi:metal-responsive CopG/Arc/MetJ family transcriptional regulator
MYKKYKNYKKLGIVKRASIPVSLAIEEVKQLDRARAMLGFRSRSELIRESIRHFLDEIGEARIIRVRKMTLEQAKREILDYLKQHNSAYVSEIANERGIDIDLAFRAARALEKEGLVK